MFYLELVSGIRKGELAALLWSDLDAEHGTISVSKQVGRNAQGEVDGLPAQDIQLRPGDLHSPGGGGTAAPGESPSSAGAP